MSRRNSHTATLESSLRNATGLYREKIGELSLIRELANGNVHLADRAVLAGVIASAIQSALAIDACAVFAPQDNKGWRYLGGASLNPVDIPPDRVATNLIDLAWGATDGIAMTGRSQHKGPPQAALALRQGITPAGTLVFTDPDLSRILAEQRELIAIVVRQVAILLDAARMFADLGDANRYLEATLTQRTQHLKEAQERLHQKEKLASLGKLVTGVSHELNNRLVPILGHAQLLTEQDLNNDAQRAVNAIEKAARGSKKIIDELLDFAHPTPASPSCCDVVDILKSVCDDLAVDYPGSCPISLAAAGEIPAIEADTQQMEQVFHNLLKNALQALCKEREGHIQISVVAGEGELSVSVSDNGTGMPETTRNRIFEPFFTTKDVGQGTGLGLSIAHGLVQGNGGSIHVESREGVGSRFTVSLPIQAGDSPMESDKRSSWIPKV